MSAAKKMLADPVLSKNEIKKVKAVVDAMEEYKVVARGFKIKLEMAVDPKHIDELRGLLVEITKKTFGIGDDKAIGWSSKYSSALEYQKWHSDQYKFLDALEAMLNKSIRGAVKELDKSSKH